MLVAGNGLATEEHILETINGLLALRTQVEKSLKSMGVTGELKALSEKDRPASASAPTVVAKKQTDKLASAVPAPEMEALLKDASAQKAKVSNADDFWNQAAEEHGKKPASAEVISLEEARKLGIISDGN
ncbi:MAG: hypothetical protein IPL27_23265 [Lewinellaceae bacterium]|nr:hypothetical protein [Lewinellaceae bacterium]